MPARPFGKTDRQVELADAPLCLVSHPGGIASDVLGESRGTIPGARMSDFLSSVGMHRRTPCELGRNFDERFRDENRDWVEV
jgi:hypothetical protein